MTAAKFESFSFYFFDIHNMLLKNVTSINCVHKKNTMKLFEHSIYIF